MTIRTFPSVLCASVLLQNALTNSFLSRPSNAICPQCHIPISDLNSKSPFVLLATDVDENLDPDNQIQSIIQQPVLRQVYPAMLSYIAQYGHPNIPLGSSEGRKCKTVRRLHFENKLSREESELLRGMNFILGNLEDVYRDEDFDAMLEKLVRYEEEHQANFQIPKKYPPDPQLGAWVTMVRRLGPLAVPEHEKVKLDAINFSWVSTRKCGSVFMKQLVLTREKLAECETLEDVEELLKRDEEMVKWVRAQRQATKFGNLSEARQEYMDELRPGLFDWKEA